MFTEQTLEKINCQMACTVYDKFETEIYSLFLCPSDYNKQKMKENSLLRDLLKYCKDNKCSFCNIQNIKLLI